MPSVYRLLRGGPSPAHSLLPPACSGLRARRRGSIGSGGFPSLLSDKSCQEAQVTYPQKECTIRVSPREARGKTFHHTYLWTGAPFSARGEKQPLGCAHPHINKQDSRTCLCYLCAQANDTHQPTNRRASPSTWKDWLRFQLALVVGQGNLGSAAGLSSRRTKAEVLCAWGPQAP